MSSIKALVSNYLNNHTIYNFKINKETIIKNIITRKDFQIFLLSELMIIKLVKEKDAFEFISLSLDDDTISSELKAKVNFYYNLI